jgi:hypothetical protein
VLVLDRAKQAYLQQELVAAETELQSAEKVCRDAENHVSELQADLVAIRKQVVGQERVGQEQAAKHLSQEVVHKSIRTCFSFPDIGGAWDRGVARARPRHRHMGPSCEMIYRQTSLQNATWRHSYEMIKFPSSPTWSIAR